MRRITLISVFALFAAAAFCQPQLSLEPFATGLSNPVDIANAGDDRMFVVERIGYIKIVDALGNVNPVNFLDIHSEIESGYQEQGLLGLAFPPDYAASGFFYVYYTDLDGNTTVSRFSRDGANPDLADPTSEEILFTASQPFVNHNGGCIKFGPDGYLYIGLGDGGSAGDPGNRAQNPTIPLGKMLRIDVNGALPYEIPADNPFAAAVDTLQEIWAMGYRNPWRYSFDALTGDMWVGDVGQNLHEEVDVEPAGSGGHNYGWRCYEGFAEFNTAGCADDSTYVFPIYDYPHNYTTGGFAITGGFVYRGSDYPGMYGYYITADYVSGNWWYVNGDAGAPYSFTLVEDVHGNISCFGVDTANEMYCADLSSGTIYHVTDACGDFDLTSLVTDHICGVQDGAVDLSIISGTAPFDIEWSEGSVTEDISGLDAGTYTATVTDDAGCVRTETVTVNEVPPFVATLLVAGNTITASPGVTWQWYQDGTLIPGATDASYTATEDGTYSCLVTDANGCSDMSDEVALVVNGIISTDPQHAIRLYPDPVVNNLHLSFYAEGINETAMVEIFTTTGQLLFSESFLMVSGENIYGINVTSLPSGIYLLRIGSSNESITRNFVVTK